MPFKSTVKKFGHFLYEKLVKINDSPQRIALGFGLGVFFGILPFMGPLAALCAAFILRVNRVAAFTGGIITNTWISLLTLILALKIGAWVTRTDWQMLYEQYKALFSDFHIKNFFQKDVLLNTFIPLFVGYAIVGAFFAIISYIGILYYIRYKRQRAARQ